MSSNRVTSVMASTDDTLNDDDTWHQDTTGLQVGP